MDINRLLWLSDPKNAAEALGPIKTDMDHWLATGEPTDIASYFKNFNHMESFAARDAWISQYGYVVPNPDFTTLTDLGPFLELGAGKGTLSQLLRAAGADSIAIDQDPWENSHEVVKMDAHTAFATYPGRTLLVSWPDLGSFWLNTLIPQMEKGQHLVLIGEGCGGCTGDEDLWDTLESNLQEVTHSASVWSFPGIHDFLSVWKA